MNKLEISKVVITHEPFYRIKVNGRNLGYRTNLLYSAILNNKLITLTELCKLTATAKGSNLYRPLNCLKRLNLITVHKELKKRGQPVSLSIKIQENNNE